MSTDPYGSLTEVFKATLKSYRQKAGVVEEKPVAFKAIGTHDGVIIGIGAAAENVDLDDEVVRKSALVKMAYDFCSASNRVFKANHQEPIDCALVASWPGAPVLKSGKVLAEGEELPDDDPIVAINLEKGKETHWFVAVRPSDSEIADLAAKGGIAGFSWAGYVTRTEVKE